MSIDTFIGACEKLPDVILTHHRGAYDGTGYAAEYEIAFTRFCPQTVATLVTEHGLELDPVNRVGAYAYSPTAPAALNGETLELRVGTQEPRFAIVAYARALLLLVTEPDTSSASPSDAAGRLLQLAASIMFAGEFGDDLLPDGDLEQTLAVLLSDTGALTGKVEDFSAETAAKVLKHIGLVSTAAALVAERA